MEDGSTRTSSADQIVPQGLTSSEAAQRLREFGPNEPVQTKQVTAIVEFLLLFANPLVIILLVASSVSFVVGDWINASIIITMILLGVILNFLQTRKSKKAADSLRKEVSVTAKALRDGQWKEIPRRSVVPDDVIRLSAGDLVPADAVIIESRGLHVQESALTGESLPVEKTPAADRNNATDVDRVFLGTSVISGTATAVVTETGPNARFGQIAARLVTKPPETEFERGTRKFGFFIVRVIFLLVIFVFLANTLMHRDLLESLLFSIALAVGLTPEFLPMITTVTLGQGAIRMSRQKVIVKHLEAIQNFGSIDILCSDKTGTLTKGEMSLQSSVDAEGNESEVPFGLAYVNCAFLSGRLDPTDQNAKIAEIADPIDSAIIEHEHLHADDYTKVDEIPFDFDRRRVSVIAAKNGQRYIITKGAPENVLAVCSGVRSGNEIVPLASRSLLQCNNTYRSLSEKGLRLVAVASSEIQAKSNYSIGDETDLTLEGFLTFADELIDTAAEALKALARDGVQVKILTGDNDLVAKYVCGQVGLDENSLITGDKIAKLDDIALAHVAEETAIFARVSPIQKNRIILALKRRGHVVGFLGDGINDAPSLHSADVGISVATATDVAKDAAEIVLMEPGLDVLHNGILEGRRSFGNVMKYLLMGTSSNFGNMFSMAAAVLFLPFLPMKPVQIILNNFLYDLAQITIPSDSVDASFIQKPHKWDISLIRDFMIYIGPISSLYDFATFYVLLHFFSASEQLFHTGWFVESLATQTLVVFVIRTAGNPLKSRPSVALTATVIAVVAFALILPFTPLAELLGFIPLPPAFLLFVLIATVTYLGLVEVVKRKLMKRWITA
jgi:Mg2+-importing ATPase